MATCAYNVLCEAYYIYYAEFPMDRVVVYCVLLCCLMPPCCVTAMSCAVLPRAVVCVIVLFGAAVLYCVLLCCLMPPCCVTAVICAVLPRAVLCDDVLFVTQCCVTVWKYVVVHGCAVLY